MASRAPRITLFALATFDALTAIGGGVAMLVGADQFPLAWLQGTPFTDYTYPALILAIVVGGSSLAASILLIAKLRWGLISAMAAGALMAGYQVVEVLMLNDETLISWIEGVYLAIGLLIFAMAAGLWAAGRTREAMG